MDPKRAIAGRIRSGPKTALKFVRMSAASEKQRQAIREILANKQSRSLSIRLFHAGPHQMLQKACQSEVRMEGFRLREQNDFFESESF